MQVFQVRKMWTGHGKDLLHRRQKSYPLQSLHLTGVLKPHSQPAAGGNPSRKPTAAATSVKR